MTGPVPRKCETRDCHDDVLEPVRNETAIDQSQGTLPGWIWTCTHCGWKRIEPIPGELGSNGWTASRSPCRRETDVDAR